MRKLFVVALMLLAMASYGKRPISDSIVIEKQHSVRIGYGFAPLIENFTYPRPLSPIGISPDYAGEGYISGSIFVDYSYRVLPWLELGGIVAYSNYTQKYYDRITDQKVGHRAQNSVSVLANVRFNYLNRRYVRLYSAVAVGMVINSTQTKYGGAVDDDTYLRFGGQVTFLGVSVGRRLYGFAELLSMGSVGFVNAGIGYRFKAK